VHGARARLFGGLFALHIVRSISEPVVTGQLSAVKHEILHLHEVWKKKITIRFSAIVPVLDFHTYTLGPVRVTS
jgi:hypothetical protein